MSSLLPGTLAPGASRGAMAYRTVNARSSSPLELVVMAYDGAIGFLQQARDANEKKDAWGRARGVSKALALIAELRNTLNLDEGQGLAQDLDRLYDYMMGRLLEVTTKRDPSGLEEVQRLLTTVREGWVQVSASVTPPQP